MIGISGLIIRQEDERLAVASRVFVASIDDSLSKLAMSFYHG